MLENNVSVASSCEEAAEDAHAIAIMTEWDEFKDRDFDRIYDSMKKPAFMFDGRNILDACMLREKGFQIESIGKSQS